MLKVVKRRESWCCSKQHEWLLHFTATKILNASFRLECLSGSYIRQNKVIGEIKVFIYKEKLSDLSVDKYKVKLWLNVGKTSAPLSHSPTRTHSQHSSESEPVGKPWSFFLFLSFFYCNDPELPENGCNISECNRISLGKIAPPPRHEY